MSLLRMFTHKVYPTFLKKEKQLRVFCPVFKFFVVLHLKWRVLLVSRSNLEKKTFFFRKSILFLSCVFLQLFAIYYLTPHKISLPNKN